MFTRPGFLACSLLLVSTTAFAADNTASVLEPVIQRDTVELDIPSRDFEVGIVGGLISADGYSVGLGAGIKLGYHFNNHWFTEASLFQTKSVDTKGGEVTVTKEGQEITVADLVVGYNLYQDTYLSSNFRAQSSIYAIGGAGLTHFKGSNFKTIVGGAGYRIMLSDNVSARAEIRGNLHSAFEDDVWSLDTQATLGLGYYF